MTDWINPDGTFGNLDTAPEPVKEFIEKKKATNIGDVLKSYSELESYKGVPADRFLVVPDKPDDVEGWNKIHERLGRPKTADEYKDTFTAGDIPLDKELISKFRKYAHQKGMNNEAYNSTIQFQIDAITESMKIDAANKEKEVLENEANKKIAVDNLKKKYNVKTDEQLQQLILKGKKVAEDTKLLSVFEKYKLMDNEEVISAMIDFSNKVTPSAIPAKTNETTKTKEERIKEIMNDKAFTDNMNPNHQAIMDEFVKLHGI